MSKKFLPPAMKLGQGYIFTGVCDSVHGGVSQHALQVVSQHALQQQGCVLSQHALQQQGCVLSQHALQQGVLSQHTLQRGVGVPAPRGVSLEGGLLGGGVCSRGVPVGDPLQTATAAGGTHPTGMHSFNVAVNDIGAEKEICLSCCLFEPRD